jgi:hypothetical protein
VSPPPGDTADGATIDVDAADAAPDALPDGAADAVPDGHVLSNDLDVERYELTGKFDWTAMALDATVRVTLDPKNAALATLTLDSTVDVTAVHAASGAALTYKSDATKKTLAIDLTDAARLPDGRTQVDVAYTAPVGANLRAYAARLGDPSQTRVAYTYSEPLGVATWMPCHNVPSDRAAYAAEFRMAPTDALIANGDLKKDAPDGADRVMRYETSYTLPPYLMAFAVGEMDAERGTHGTLPLAVWHRRGVPGDYAGLLAEMARLVGLDEGLVKTPFPFEKYDLVLLPDIPGGVEHAGIIFQGETSSTEPALGGDLGVLGHELGHQWFGDLVTVKTWDDLWFKEGMATLIQEEASRQYEDPKGAGTFQGDQWDLTEGAAIRDPSLEPDAKYTTGPYDRAAWLLEQLRHRAGEAKFWGALHDVLAAHAMDVIDTDTFLGQLAGGAATLAAAHRAVDAKTLPSIDLTANADGSVTATLHDPDGSILEPMLAAWIGPSGAKRTQTLAVDAPTVLTPSAGEYFVEDPDDVHPAWAALLTASSNDGYARLDGWRRPALDAELTSFEGLAGVHQRALLEELLLPAGVGPSTFAAFVPTLGADSAKALAAAAACAALPTDATWKPALQDWLAREPPYGGIGYVTAYSGCESLAQGPLFAADFAKLKAGLSTAALSEPRVSYLSRFTLDAPQALATWGPVAKSGYSVRVRRAAARYLSGYTGLAAPDLASFRAFFSELAEASEVSEVLGSALAGMEAVAGATAADNAPTRTTIAHVLHRPAARSVHYEAVCAAYALSDGDAQAWAAFKALVADAKLSPIVLSALGDAATYCGP